MPGAADWYDPPEDSPLYQAPPPAASADLVAPDRQRVTYTVQPGDTLTGIAADLQNTPRGAGTIATLNRLPNANRIQAGQQLQVTPADVGRLPSAGAVQVQQGDTLEGIAGRLGVDPTDLYRANAHQIANPNNIYPGQRLSLPYSPSTTPPATAADTSSAATSSAQAPAGPPQSTAGQERRQSDLDRRFADLQQSMAASNVQDRKENQDGTYYLADRPLADQPKGLGFDADGWIRHVRDSLGNGLGGLASVSDNGAGLQSATGEPASIPQSDVDAARTAYQATFSGEHARAGEQELAAQPVVPDVLGGVRQGAQDIAQGVQNRDVLGTLGGAAQVLGAAGVALPGALGAESLVSRGAKAAEAADTAARGALPKAGDVADAVQAGGESARAPEVQAPQELPTAARPEAPPAEPVASAEPAPATPAPASGPEPVQPAQPAQAGNPYMLPTEPGPGRVPLSDDELVTHVEGLAGHYEQLDQRIQLLENRLEGGSFTRGSGGFRGDVVRPPWGAGWTDDALRTLAQKNDLNPYEDGWWEQANFVKGSGELREDVGQSGLRGTGATQQTATSARRELATLRTQRDQVLAAIDHLDQAPEGARFYATEPPSTTDLPFDSGVPDNGASAATPATDSARANPSGGAARPQDAPGSLEAAAGAREPASGAGSPAPAGPATFGQDLDAPRAAAPPAAQGEASAAAVAKPLNITLEDVRGSAAYRSATPAEQSQMLGEQLRSWTTAQQAARDPDTGALKAGAAAPEPTSEQVSAAAAARQSAPLPPAASESPARAPTSAPEPYDQTELAAGISPQALGRAVRPIADKAEGVFSPASQTPAPIQAAIGRYDGSIRQGAAMADTLLRQGAVTQQDAVQAARMARFAARDQLVQDIAQSPAGVVPKSLGSRPPGWVDGAAANGTAGLRGVWLDPSVKTAVDNLLGQPGQLQGVVQKFANAVGLAKDIELSGSPFHAGWELTSVLGDAANGVNPAPIMGKATQAYLSPGAYDAWRLAAADRYEAAAKAGVTLPEARDMGEAMDLLKGPVGTAIRASVGAAGGAARSAAAGEPGVMVAAKGALGAGSGAAGSVLGPALWERLAPVLKVETWDQLIRAGMPAEQAAARTNEVFGGLNQTRLARSPALQLALRTGAFAPDVWEGQLRTWGRALGNPNPLQNPAARFLAAGLGMKLAISEGLNYLATGHAMQDNGPGHQWEADVTNLLPGTKATSDRGVNQRVYVDTLQFYKPVLEAAQGVVQGSTSDLGRVASGRLSQPIRMGMELSANKDGLGRPIVQPGAQGAQALGQVASYVSQQLQPAGATSLTRAYEQGGTGPAALTATTGLRTTVQTDTAVKLNQRDDLLAKRWPGLETQIKQTPAYQQSTAARQQQLLGDQKAKLQQDIDLEVGLGRAAAGLPPKYLGVNDSARELQIDRAIQRVNTWERDPQHSPRPSADDRQLENRYGGNINPAYAKARQGQAVQGRALDELRLAGAPTPTTQPRRDLTSAPQPAGSR